MFSNQRWDTSVVDYILMSGGQRTIIAHLHPVLSNMAIGVVALTALWLTYLVARLLIERKWKKAIFTILSVGTVFIGANLIIDHLSQVAHVKADQIAKLVLSTAGVDYKVEVEKDAMQSFALFKKQYDATKIIRYNAVPILNRYNYIVKPESTKPFMVSIWVRRNNVEILISQKGVEYVLEDLSQRPNPGHL